MQYIYNPFYDVTNSIASLWLAREQLSGEDTIVANADVFWDEAILELLLGCRDDVHLLADRERADDGDYFFYVDESGMLRRYGKELRREERNAEYVGIAYLSASFVPHFRERLEEMICRQEHGVWWENVIYSMIEERQVHVLDTCGHFWAEIDFIEDYERILAYVSGQDARKHP